MKVGDYIRTRKGIICKIVGGNEDNYDIDIPFKTIEDSEDFGEHFLEYNDNGRYFSEDIIKSDPELIELVQVGDYVNGYKISKIIHYEDMGTCLESEFIDYGNKYIKCFGKKEIKSIVTKEQFESMEYKV